MPTASKSKTTPATEAGSEYRHDMPINRLVKHLHNPRHRATADAELVGSVKASGILQPLIVAPGAGDNFWIIAGHRRQDAAKKARLKTVPVVIRHDLTNEAQQIEAMLIENGRRVDLSPIEEAEGYHQLELLGYKPAAIADAVGRDVKTVRSRLRLLKLSASTRKRVHAGQLTIDNATSIIEFADDPDLTKRLEKAASSTDGYTWKHELQAARRLKAARQEAAARTAKLLDAGATEVKLGDDQGIWSIRDGVKFADLGATHSTDWGQHKKCLAFVVTEDSYHGPQVHELCSNPKSHQAKLDKDAREAAAAVERREAEAKQRGIDEAAASDVRVQTLIDLLGGDTVSPALGDLIRALLPILIRELSGNDLEAYQHAMGIPATDRWDHLGYHHVKPIDVTHFREHIKDLVSGGNAFAAKAMAAVLIAEGEGKLVDPYSWNDAGAEHALAYADLLQEAGHSFSPIDTAHRDRHQERLDQAAEKAKAS